MIDDNEESEDFLLNYQLSLFEEDPNDLFKTCRSKRKCLFLEYSRANLCNCNKTSCSILKEGLFDYAALVDDRNGINNFAEATLSLLADSTNGGKSLKSGLPDKAPNISEILKPLSGNCVNSFGNGCTSTEPSLSDLQTLFFDEKRDSPSKTVQVTKPKIQEVQQKRRKKPLYSNCLENLESSETHSSFQERAKGWNKNKPEYHVSEESFRRGTTEKNFIRNVTKKDDQDDTIKFCSSFKTAREQLKIDNTKKYNTNNTGSSSYSQKPIKKTLGGKSLVSNKFVPPIRNSGSQEENFESRRKIDDGTCDEEEDERLRHIDPKMVELIRNEIMDSQSKIVWDDIAGLEFAKTTIQEIVVWPMLRPDIFTGLRKPPKGILLFGPPGTGKTLIGKCIASQSKSTFFSISASSLTSKWIGDGEKMVRALFAVARVHQPAVVFIDEIDSLLSQRSDTEHESSRRIKTEFLVQLDGTATGEDDRILVIGATNRPQELDEAARRRLVKRLYIPLPNYEARRTLVGNLMLSERNDLTEEHIEEIGRLTDGFSGADMKNLCQEACLGPIRLIGAKQMFNISAEEVRPVNLDDFKSALRRVKSSVSPKDLETYIAWDSLYGSGGIGP